MPLAVLKDDKLYDLSMVSQRRILIVLCLGSVISILAYLFLEPTAQRVVLVSACSAIAGSCLLFGASRFAQFQKASGQRNIAACLAHDPMPVIVTDRQGRVTFANVGAEGRWSTAQGQAVADVLKSVVANPVDTVARLMAQAEAQGAASEAIFSETKTTELQVHTASQGCLVWRLQEHVIKHASGCNETLPVLYLSDSGTIQEANDAAQSLLGGEPKHLDRVFTSLPVAPGRTNDVSTKSGTVPFIVHEGETCAGTRFLILLPDSSEQATQEDWSVFQRLPVSLIKVDATGRVQDFNRMATQLVGPSLKDCMYLSDVMEGLGRPITDWLKETLSGRSSNHTEFLRLKRTDKEAFVQVGLNRVQTEDGPALIAVLTDATELKTLEAQFVQSQKMQAIGQLAGGVAHDFNNLLTAISGHCDLLLLRHDQGDPAYNDLVQINQNANRAAALVSQLLAFSRKQTLRPETLDMRNTLSDLTHLLNRLVGEKVTLTLSHDPVLKPIRADKRQLEQVIMNLVVNARDAMPEGGEIRIVTEMTTLKEPLTRDRVSVPAGTYVSVQVQDDGVGIPSDKLQKVFEPFYTTKRVGEGTGLGLSTAYGIVKQTGGYIFVDSIPGSGTAFTLHFPVLEVSTVPEPSSAQVPAPHRGIHGDGVILLVEDEAPVRAFASRALRLRGYTVLEADSAEAALRTLEDEALNIDVFVTDVVMPGMDGPTWVKEALKKRPDVRVVFVSGYAEDSFGETQTRIPNSVFLPKPFSLNDLTDTVNQQIYQHASRASEQV